MKLLSRVSCFIVGCSAFASTTFCSTTYFIIVYSSSISSLGNVGAGTILFYIIYSLLKKITITNTATSAHMALGTLAFLASLTFYIRSLSFCIYSSVLSFLGLGSFGTTTFNLWA